MIKCTNSAYLRSPAVIGGSGDGSVERRLGWQTIPADSSGYVETQLSLTTGSMLLLCHRCTMLMTTPIGVQPLLDPATLTGYIYFFLVKLDRFIPAISASRSPFTGAAMGGQMTSPCHSVNRRTTVEQPVHHPLPLSLRALHTYALGFRVRCIKLTNRCIQPCP